MAHPDNSKRLQVAERRRKAAAMKLSGMTYEAIAEALKDEGYSDRVHVYNDLKLAREQANRETARNLEDLRQETNERYEALVHAHWKKALSGDNDATNTVLRILTQQATLNGTNAPKDLRLQLERRDDMEALLVTEAVLAAFDAAGIPPELRMVALEAAQRRLEKVDDHVVAGQIVASEGDDEG
jgi:transcriptional regulator of met regulon